MAQPFDPSAVLITIGRRVLILLWALSTLAATSSSAWAQPTGSFSPPTTIDGPSPGIVGLSGIAVARDGSGGLAYVKNVLGVPHVFVSQLLGGTFEPPVEVDAALSGPSSQPVIGAGPGGLLLIAFINGGDLYVVDNTAEPARYSQPQQLFTGSSNPTIATTYLDKAYLAFTATGDGGHDVRCAYYYQGSWAVAPTPLDANPSDDAGTGNGAPDVAASGDGVGIVAWGEAGHVYVRRVWGTSPSTAYYEADLPSWSGWNEVSATSPSVATGGNSSYVNVAFDETLTDGSHQQSRVFLHRLIVSEWQPPSTPDGLTTPGSEGAAEPQLVMDEYGDGLATAARSSSNQLWVEPLGDNGTPGPAMRLDSLTNAAAPDAVTIGAGFYSGLVAWQENPGPPGAPEIEADYYARTSFQPAQVLSIPGLGPTDAAAGLAAGADISADVAVGWVQGPSGERQIEVAQLYQPPGSFGASTSFQYARTVQPVLAWSASRDLWGVNYRLFIDGTQVATSTATKSSVPPLTQGRHTWNVEAVNDGGLTSSSSPATVFVDTNPPSLDVTVTGKPQVGKQLHVYVIYSDTPPGGTPADGSGVSLVTVNWGDGHEYVIKHGKFHAYAKPGRYRITVTASDRAGNTNTNTTVVQIRPKPKPKPKHKRTRHRHRGRR
jgi:hypothetical protein